MTDLYPCSDPSAGATFLDSDSDNESFYASDSDESIFSEIGDRGMYSVINSRTSMIAAPQRETVRAPSSSRALLNTLNPATPLLPEGDSDIDSDLDFEPEDEDEDDDEEYEADAETESNGDISDDDIVEGYNIEVVRAPSPMAGVKRGAEKLEDSDDEESVDMKKIRWWREEDDDPKEGPPSDCICGECW